VSRYYGISPTTPNRHPFKGVTKGLKSLVTLE
jgi:hypothetical protein